MIDQSVNLESIQLPQFSEPLLVHNTPRPRPPYSQTSVPVTVQYPLRYTVHRQHVGFFTPMVFDLRLIFHVESVMSAGALYHLNRIVEPFVEGALFCNHDSFAIVEFIKGQNFGFNRKEELESIRDAIRRGNVWYSDWQTPPITIQNQRIFVYDLATQGSMLDPHNVSKFIANSFLKAVQLDGLSIFLTGGYANPVDIHGAPRP